MTAKALDVMPKCNFTKVISNFILKYNPLRTQLETSQNLSGAPNDQLIFPSMSELSQMVFSVAEKPVWLIWSCPVRTVYLLGCRFRLI